MGEARDRGDAICSMGEAELREVSAASDPSSACKAGTTMSGWS